MKFIFLILASIWLFNEHLVFDIPISIFLHVITLKAFFAMLIGFIQKKGRFLENFLNASLFLVFVIIMSLDQFIVFDRCERNFNKIVSEKQCDFKENHKPISARENSFLIKEKGIGTVCSIYIEITDKVFLKNIVLGHSLYSKDNCD